jgi:hypothetical protein
MPRRISIVSIFGLSAILTAILLGVVGFNLGINALFTMLTLTMLEITFSLDNAVVNATILQHMSPLWQRMFMTVGIIIAVFGMRLLFPLALVSNTAGLGLGDVVILALQHPTEYSARLALAEPMIAAFGGLFLLMIFLGFVFDDQRKSLWQHLLRRTLKKISTLRFTQIFIALLVLLFMIFTTPKDIQLQVAVAGLLGIAAHLIVGTLADLFSTRRPMRIGGTHMPWRAGLVMFLYLELLDASFSFDSAIGAFAITSNAVLIAAGLGAGALWVRSITIYLVRRGTLTKFPYLDAGAHYAIGALAVLLLVGIHVALPTALTGSLGLIIIAVSFVASLLKNHQVKRAAKFGA